MIEPTEGAVQGDAASARLNHAEPAIARRNARPSSVRRTTLRKTSWRRVSMITNTTFGGPSPAPDEGAGVRQLPVEETTTAPAASVAAAARATRSPRTRPRHARARQTASTPASAARAAGSSGYLTRLRLTARPVAAPAAPSNGARPRARAPATRAMATIHRPKPPAAIVATAIARADAVRWPSAWCTRSKIAGA